MNKRILFICIGNACRSIMAEALMNHYWGAAYEVSSAGMHPLGRIAEETIAVLEEIGVSTETLRSKGLREFDLKEIDCIVNLSEYPLEGLAAHGFSGKLINWYVRDPYGRSIDSYRKARDTIEWLVTEKIPEILDSDHFTKN